MDNMQKTVAHYHLPGLFEFYELYRVFLPLFREHREYFYSWCDIGSIYGAPADCIWGGGRVGFGDNDPREVLALTREYGISARLTFSNSLLREEHLSDKQCNRLCALFHETGGNGVIVHSDLLLEYLKGHYPNLYFVSSTTKVLTDFQEFADEVNREDFRYVVPDFRLNKAFDKLNTLTNAQKGKVEFLWHHASIRGIICNLTYTGVLRSGESRSQVLPHLQIITPELFEAAQHIRTSRANSAEQERRVPLNTRGQSLLAGNVFCGHCGSRLSLTTNGKAYPCKDDPNRIVRRVRYVCYGKTRKQTECDGQTGYTAHTLDGIIDKLVRQIFERMKAVPKSEIVNVRYKEKMDERRALLRSIRADYTKSAGELEMLRAEVIKSLRGESAFSQSLLGSLIADAETKCLEVQQQLEAAQAAYDEGQAVLASLNAQYDDIISWADMYDTASIEAKKMIVNCLIKRVDVYRDYKLHIDFNIDFEQFSMGLDIVWIAA